MRTIILFFLLSLACSCDRQAPSTSSTPTPEEKEREIPQDSDNSPDHEGMDVEQESERIEEAYEKPALGDLTIHPGLGFGAISGRTDRAQLELTYGRKRIASKSFYIGEGYSEPGLVVYPGTEDEVEILLDEKGAFNLVRVTREDSRWHTDGGIRIGSTLQEVERANGRPFQFFGLDWDYGGTVADWQGGRFPEGFGIRFDWGESPTGGSAKLPIGDDLFSSGDYPQLDLRVVAITQQLTTK